MDKNIKLSILGTKKRIKNFVNNNNFVMLSTAIIIGHIFKGFFESLIDNIIYPLVTHVINKTKIKKWHIKLNIDNLNIGNFIMDVIFYILSLVVVCFFIEFVLNRFLSETPTAILTEEDINELEGNQKQQ